jgi:cell division protease FtsH
MNQIIFFILLFSFSNGFFSPITKNIRGYVSMNMNYRKYPISSYNEQYLKRLNSKNATIQNNEILNNQNDGFYNPAEDGDSEMFDQLLNNNSTGKRRSSGVRIIINKSVINQLSADLQNANNVGYTDEQQSDYYDIYGNPMRSYGKRGESSSSKTKKSEHFEVIEKPPINFNHVGGYNNIKNELNQCIDILSNYAKYVPYNVRVPKGLIFEGPPGNGKTLLAKALAGEAKTGFIAVSGSEFQEKYVGVGSSRIRELFKLAKQNIPCIIFIDEIDALGRKRSSDGDTSGNERDSTLNELLVALDGFKNTSGIFVIGATNRADLLDTALTRPGRIDKRIYIGNPDKITRKAILNIHSSGKPYDSTIHIDNLVEITNGFSGAQIENLLNEAMLNALRENRNKFTNSDIDVIVNKMLAGWQPSEHQFTTDIIDQIAIHELGHAIVGMLSTHHAKMTKVIINLSSPNSPAYTVFESSSSNILTREALFEHLMILLAGRIAEEVFYGVSVTTGAINDFEEALKLAEKMVCYYGMGKKIIYPSMSEKYKEIIDEEVAVLINDAYGYAEFIIRNSKELIEEGSDILKRDKILSYDSLVELMNLKYKSVLNLKI